MAIPSTIGARLRSERGRLLLTQKEAGKLGGVASNAQGNYEADLRSPSANYLAALLKADFDVLFILSGKRSTKD